jgi:hypothetical protein
MELLSPDTKMTVVEVYILLFLLSHQLSLDLTALYREVSKPLTIQSIALSLDSKMAQCPPILYSAKKGGDAT